MSPHSPIPSLPPGAFVGGTRLERCLGAEAGWIYYAGEQEGDGKKVVVQEIFPLGHAERVESSVWPREDWLRNYHEMLRTARETANRLASVTHRHVWRLRRTVEANGTLYFFFDWVDGPNLSQRLTLLGRPATPVEAGILLDQLLSATEALHAAGLTHGSLDPERIIMRRGEEPLLGGFKWFRLFPDSSAVPASAYAALENDAATTEMPASCDIYSVAAILFRAITGETPPSATERVRNAIDPCLFALEKLRGVFPPQFLASLREAFHPRPADRLPSVAAWRRSLSGPPMTDALPEASYHSPLPEWRPSQPPAVSNRRWAVIAALAIFGCAFTAWKWGPQFLHRASPGNASSGTAPPEVPQNIESSPPAKLPPPVPKVESPETAAADVEPAGSQDDPPSPVAPQKSPPTNSGTSANTAAPLIVPADTPDTVLNLPPEAIKQIADRIWTNECGHTISGLTSWNAGENFASLGIGHFIWYPAGVEGPFEESFPALLKFLRDERYHAVPARIADASDCPWPDKKAFDAARNSAEMKELRDFLAATVSSQAEFTARRFLLGTKRIIAAVPESERPPLEEKIRLLTETPGGLYAMIDYVNFKGEGLKPEERYQEIGWGLLQVLQEMKPASDPPLPGQTPSRAAAVEFSRAAARVLERRIQLSPPERGEERWKKGWLSRCAGYATAFVLPSPTPSPAPSAGTP